MSPLAAGNRRPKRTKLGWCGGEAGQGEPRVRGRQRKGRENKTSTHASSRFLTKVTPRSVRSGTSSSKKEAIPTQGARKQNRHSQGRARTQHPSPSSHARLPMCVLCCALKLKSEKCSVNDPRSRKHKSCAGRGRRPLDADEGWRETLSSTKRRAALFFLETNPNHSCITTVLQTARLAHPRRFL